MCINQSDFSDRERYSKNNIIGLISSVSQPIRNNDTLFIYTHTIITIIISYRDEGSSDLLGGSGLPVQYGSGSSVVLARHGGGKRRRTCAVGTLVTHFSLVVIATNNAIPTRVQY